MSTAMAKISRVPFWIGIMNPLMRAVLRLGLPMGPMILLTVRGRTSGQPRTTPVGLFERSGQRWLFSEFGDVNWVRNLRAAGEGTLRLGRRRETVVVVELTSEAAAHVLKEVVAPWLRSPMGAMATVMAGGSIFRVPFDAPVTEFIQEVPRHPVFELRPARVAHRRAGARA